MTPIKLILASALFTILALAATRADAQNGSGPSSEQRATTDSSSNRQPEEGDSTLGSPTFQSNMELDEHYDKSGLNQHFDKSGLDENYDKSGFDEHYDKSGIDNNYYKSESVK